MTPPFNCPNCSRRIAAKGLTHCPACGASFSQSANEEVEASYDLVEDEVTPTPAKPPVKAKPVAKPPVVESASKPTGTKKKAKKKAAAKPNWLMIGSGVAGGVLLLVLLGWLFFGGKKADFDNAGGVRTGDGDYAVVDQWPDAPARAPVEVAVVPEPEPKQKSMIPWEVKADLVEKPVDFSNAVGAVGPEQEFLLASNGGHCGIFIPPMSFYAPDKRMKQFLDEKTGANRQEPLAGTPFAVVDMLSGKPLGEFKVDLVSIWHRLSKDGTYLAGLETKANQKRYDFLADFVVYKRDTDKPVLRWKPLDTIQWFDFIDATKIALWYGGPAQSLVILDLEKGGPVQTVTLPKPDGTPNDAKPNPKPQYTNPVMGNGAVSPNGAYVVLGESQRLLFYSPKEARWVGQINLASSYSHDLEGYRALCFNETGSELRAMVNFRPMSSDKQVELRVWSMPNGELLHKLSLRFATLYGHRLFTGPEPGTLVVANKLVELSTGTLLEELSFSPLAWAGKDHLFALAGTEKLVNGKELKSAVPYYPYIGVGRVPFNRAEFAAKASPILEKARETGAIPTTSFDRSTMTRVKTGPTANWSVKPSATPPVPADAASKTWPMLFAATEGANVQDQRWTRIDLKTGDSIGEPIQLGPTRQQVLNTNPAKPALSLDGRYLAFSTPQEPNRIDIWDNTGKHLVGLRPYRDEVVEWIDWSSKGHLLTVSGNRLTGWDLGNKKAIFEVEGNFKSRTLSGGKDWVLLSTLAENLDFIDANTGTHLGRIPSEGANRFVTVSPDGKTLLRTTPSAIRDGEGGVQVWDLTTGQKSTAPESSEFTVDGQWVNPRRIVVSSQKARALYDLDAHAVTYKYLLSDVELRTDTLGRGWMLRPEDPAAPKGGPKVWGTVRVPGAEGFKGEVGFGPGSTVKVEIDVGHAEYNKRIAQTLAEYLRDRGMKIGKGGWTFRADHTVGESSRNFSRPSGEKYTASFASLKIQWTLISPEGKPVWEVTENGQFSPQTTKYVKVGSRKRDFQPGGGGYESWQLDYDGKNPRKAQIEEIIETGVLFRGGKPPSMPGLVAKTETGYESLPIQAKVDGSAKP